MVKTVKNWYTFLEEEEICVIKKFFRWLLIEDVTWRDRCRYIHGLNGFYSILSPSGEYALSRDAVWEKVNNPVKPYSKGIYLYKSQAKNWLYRDFIPKPPDVR